MIDQSKFDGSIFSRNISETGSAPFFDETSTCTFDKAWTGQLKYDELFVRGRVRNRMKVKQHSLRYIPITFCSASRNTIRKINDQNS
jgi:hypothetical protein